MGDVSLDILMQSSHPLEWKDSLHAMVFRFLHHPLHNNELITDRSETSDHKKLIYMLFCTNKIYQKGSLPDAALLFHRHLL
jgi:hypothetical protein